MQVSKLTFLGFYLNGAAGSGKYDDVTIADIKREIRAGSVFEFLKTRLGDDVDISALSESERRELLDQWESLADNVDEARKMCVDRGGLTLLVAYLLEGIQLLKR